MSKFNDINNPQKASKLSKGLVQKLQEKTLALFINEAKLESEFKQINNVIEQQKGTENETVEEEKLAEYNRVRKDLEVNFKTLVR